MRKVTAYDLSRKAQQFAQNFNELSIRFLEPADTGLAAQIRKTSAKMAGLLLFSSNYTTDEYINTICRVVEYNENLVRYLILARDLGYISFYEWKRYTADMILFGQTLQQASKEKVFESNHTFPSFTQELYTH